MTNAEITAEIQRGNDRAKELLLTENEGFIKWAARKFAGLADIEDLQQDARLAMLEAAQTYDPAKGSFASWAYIYIRVRILRSNGPVYSIPERLNSLLYSYRRYLPQYEMRTGREPTDAEICDDLDITPAELDEIRRADLAANAASLQAPTETGDELGDTIPAQVNMADEVEQAADEEIRAFTIWRIVDELPPAQAETIRQKYREGKTITAISETNPHARQDESKGLRALRKDRHIKIYMDELYNTALQHTGVEQFKRTWTSATEWAAFKDMGI